MPLAILIASLLVGRALPPAQIHRAGGKNAIVEIPYRWQNVAIVGGGFVPGIVIHPKRRGLMYCRTDIGGAYRWDARAQKWIPLLDWLPWSDSNLLGTESIGLDPTDPNRLYLAQGSYQRGTAAILVSKDQGRTFQRVNVPFRMGANEAGRGNGERFAVDPNSPNILYYGTRHDGLWVSTNFGSAWSKVPGFSETALNIPPAAAGPRDFPGFAQEVGVITVIPDPSSGTPGTPSKTIYAAISQLGDSIFRSQDAGSSWSAVPGQPTAFRPTHVALSPDGMLYATYGSQSGPNVTQNGAVWRFDVRSGVWTDITPIKPDPENHQPFGYAAICFDPKQPRHLLLTTHYRDHAPGTGGDELFRSLDQGAHWTAIGQQAIRDDRLAPWLAFGKPQPNVGHWMDDVKIDPFDSNRAMYVTGQTIWVSSDLTAADRGLPTHWSVGANGIEETVPLSLASPPEGAHLVSGVGDIDGFRHDDLGVSPTSGAFPAPRLTNTECVAFASSRPELMARVGSIRTRQPDETRGMFSIDGGATWKQFPIEPEGGAQGGFVCLSADGNVIVWSGQRFGSAFTKDHGATWKVSEGLPGGTRVFADSTNANELYGFQPQSGRLFVSSDAAATFHELQPALPPKLRLAGADLDPTPGLTGDLWAASRAIGLLHSTDGGLNFTSVSPMVAGAYSIGFGQAAPGQNYPALYLAGRIGKLEAIFRSDDAGATWVRINDDAHQYGVVRHVTGDPRIYGRVYFGTEGRGIVYGDPKP